MRILGISCFFHDAAAALIENGVLIAAAEEERFTRIKHDYGFPHHAISFCLEEAGIESKDLDYVVLFEKPFTKFDRILKTALQGFPKTYDMFIQSMRTWLVDKIWIKSTIASSVGISTDRILFAEHHLSHASSAYFCSPFDESAVLTFDGVGEWATTTMAIGKGNDLSITKELYFPHSIGLLYSAFTSFLGFEVNEGEYKVMGMASYGSPRYTEKIWQILAQGDDGHFWLDPKYFAFHYSTKHAYTKHFRNLFGQPRDPSIPFFTETSGFPSYYGPKPENFEQLSSYNSYYADLAASIQLVTEELILKLVTEIHNETGLSKLCLAGGVALNSVANGRILRESPFDELYIQPSAGDGGAAVGAAFFAWHCAFGNSPRFLMDHAYWGKSYGNDEITNALSDLGVKASYVEDQQKLLDISVDKLQNGAVLGWFHNKSEWGPRALGNRSILADPRKAETKDLVNDKIKFREPFRPFAPAVLAEESERYFDFTNPDKHLPARFMLLVVPVKDSAKENVQAVDHLGTARIQTVYTNSNPLYYGLIKTFGEATGTPILLNTSFNIQGEPIVNSPTDALNTYFNSGLDTLVMSNYLIEKG